MSRLEGFRDPIILFTATCRFPTSLSSCKQGKRRLKDVTTRKWLENNFFFFQERKLEVLRQGLMSGKKLRGFKLGE